MPLRHELYPANWRAISDALRERVGHRCEECGMPCRKPSESAGAFRARLVRSSPDLLGLFDDKPQRFALTVSHTDRDPSNCERSNLRVLCSGCHLRYDAKYNAVLSRETRRRREVADAG